MKLKNFPNVGTTAKLPTEERIVGADASQKLANNNLNKINKELKTYLNNASK